MKPLTPARFAPGGPARMITAIFILISLVVLVAWDADGAGRE